ncbi:MAG: hypothetical protein ACXWC9_01420 [Pseudobdellovibrionaceae bacterium]
MIRWVLFVSLMGVLAQAQLVESTPPSICDVFRSEAFRDQHFETRFGNCEKLIQSGAVPNAQALSYTLNYLAQNYKGLKDSKCAMDGLDKDYLCTVCKDPARVRQGIQNGCSFVLNDLKRPWGDGTTRTMGYYIDLCQDAAGPTVQKFYINLGTGPTNKDRKKDSDCERDARKMKFIDCDGGKTPLIGAFLTDSKISSFTPYNPDNEKYKKIADSDPCQTMKLSEIRALKKNEEDKCSFPGIRLVGLNTSNNTSDKSKPMHVSPLGSSSGCPSVSPEKTPMMKELVKNGPALVMNYHSAQYEQKASCNNDNSGTNNNDSTSSEASGDTYGGVK